MQGVREILTRFRLTPSLIWKATILGLSVQLLFFVLVAFGFYKTATEGAEKDAGNIASLLEAGLARDFELYDLSLRAVAEGMQDPEVMQQQPRIRQITLFDRSSTAKGLGALVALDASGSIVLDSLSTTPRVGNFADREYFRAHQKRELGLYISEPFRARLQKGIWSISLSRRVNKADGTFDGIVSGTLNLDYLRERFSKADVGLGGTVSLLRDDGILVVQSPAGRYEPGADWKSAPIVKKLKSSPIGTYWASSSMDGTSRVYAYRRIGDTPLVVSVGMSSRAVMSTWWLTVKLLAVAYMVMAISVIALVMVFTSELRKRYVAELAQAALARSDALTGLVNRLGFAEALDAAWRSARRTRKSLSLLMLDIDYFKQFNDVLGHLQGDEALKRVSSIVADTIRRPNDVAARYGGEEIAVLLPNTSLNEALAIAKLIRFAIEGLAIPHPNSRYRVISASIGVATAIPSDDAPLSLVARADQALYNAKDAGRNCVVIASDVNNLPVASFPVNPA
ncbi:MAG: GGDEF domain-containing protein [Pseudolabrys sp.]|nr:GGDEF domain-containing protein [Pseudolabrys sp.]